jgi:hypothetical protein
MVHGYLSRAPGAWPSRIVAVFGWAQPEAALALEKRKDMLVISWDPIQSTRGLFA